MKGIERIENWVYASGKLHRVRKKEREKRGRVERGERESKRKREDGKKKNWQST